MTKIFMNQTITTIIDGKSVELTPEFIGKYDKPLPRYTSYPTAPVWTEDVGPETYSRELAELAKNNQASDANVSLYVHLPFCEKRCTFCACYVIATKKRELIDPYLNHLEQEMDLIAKNLGR